MKINKKRLGELILKWQKKSLTEDEYLELWRDLEDICAYQIKKSKNDPEFYDMIENMVIQIFECYMSNFTEFRPDGTPNSPLAFLIQSSYFSKLILWSKYYKQANLEKLLLDCPIESSIGSEGGDSAETYKNLLSNDVYERSWNSLYRDSDFPPYRRRHN